MSSAEEPPPPPGAAAAEPPPARKAGDAGMQEWEDNAPAPAKVEEEEEEEIIPLTDADYRRLFLAIRRNDAGGDISAVFKAHGSIAADVATIIELANRGAEMDRFDARPPCLTCLMYACSVGDAGLVELLLEHKASPDPSIVSAFGWSAAQYAVHGGHMRCARLVLRAHEPERFRDCPSPPPLDALPRAVQFWQ